MFGYVKTDMPNMYVKDVILYKAMYCGLCKAIGKSCGQKGRFTLNYDLTFLSVFAHNVLGVDVKVERQRCVIHQIRKRPIAIVDDLTKRIASLNVILARYKLNDDVIDNKKGFIKRAFFNSSYKKAKKNEPKFDEIVKTRFNDLIAYERTNGDSIDIASDPFGKMMQDVFIELFNEKCTDDLKQLAYYLGKWIYLIDALDDFDKDKKKNNFNVLINSFSEVNTKEQLIKEKRDNLIFIFGSILTEIERLSNNVDYKFNHDLVNNILTYGLRNQTKHVLENKKCKNIIKY